MNAKKLADEALKANPKAAAFLNMETLHKLWLAHVAVWLSQQDESCRAAAANTACQAIEILNQWAA